MAGISLEIDCPLWATGIGGIGGFAFILSRIDIERERYSLLYDTENRGSQSYSILVGKEKQVFIISPEDVIEI